MNSSPSDTSYVEIDGDLFPADRVGPDGWALPITDEQANAIGAILAEQYESNPVFREAINAVAARLAAEEKDEGEAA